MIYNRYQIGGNTEYKGKNTFWWDRKVFGKDISDINMIIPLKYHKRPDRLADDMYGTPSLATFILQYNDMMDINTEFVQGKKISIPTPNRFTTGKI